MIYLTLTMRRTALRAAAEPERLALKKHEGDYSMMRSRSETEGWLRDTLKGGDSMDGQRLKRARERFRAQSSARFIGRLKLSA